MMMPTLLLLLATSADGAVPRELFDGKSLKGWDGDTSIWRVDGGHILGDSPGLDRNQFLCTKEMFGDFELLLRFRVDGDDTRNSGVQFRSRRAPGSTEVIGYQADVGQKYWGALYDEHRRRKVLAAPSPEVARRAARPDGWNTYRIRAQGPRIELILNDVQTVAYVEPDASIDRAGVICLQVHSGTAVRARFTDIKIRTLRPS